MIAMTLTPEFERNRLTWRFRKSGADGRHVRQFAGFDEGTRSTIARLAGMTPQELPALACYFDDQAWVLLTSERLVWETNGQRTSMNLGEIADATVDAAALRLARA